MKQLRLIKNGKGIKKYRFPVALHLNQAGRPLSTPHGGRYYMYCLLAIKKANRQELANIVA